MSKDDEIFDVVDENDNVIGTATRGQCHSDPKLIHRTVQFAIYSEKTGKLLVARRSAKADAAPNQLAFFGEHIQAGETYINALKRGLKEELRIESYDAEFLKTHHFIYDQQHEIVCFYLITISIPKARLEKGKLFNKLWLTKNEINARVNNFADHTQYWIRNVSWFQHDTTAS